jgi:hypothetical protein
MVRRQHISALSEIILNIYTSITAKFTPTILINITEHVEGKIQLSLQQTADL